jgi:hypothetical protein
MAAVPVPARVDGPSFARRLQVLVDQRADSGSRTRTSAAGLHCTWEKLPGGLLFAMKDARGIAVTLDTRYGGRQRGVRLVGGMVRHSPLYVWGDGTGRWPARLFAVLTTCMVYENDHWHDGVSPEVSVGLVNSWVGAGGDDEVVWTALEREYEVLFAKFGACVSAKRAAAIAALRERRRPEEAANVENSDPQVLERKLLILERKNIIAERERRQGKTRRLIENMRAAR